MVLARLPTRWTTSVPLLINRPACRLLMVLTSERAALTVVVLAVKSQVQLAPFRLIAATGAAYGATYAGLVWRFNLLNQSEREAIAGWVRRAWIATGLAQYERE